MADNKDDRMKEFERSLDPNIAKFAPKKPTAVPMATLIAQVREQAQVTLKLCEEMDQFVASSEADARKAADLLISMAERIK